MNINRAEILAQTQANLTYNGSHLKVPRDNKLNIFMGIGLWSAKDRLSIGLPIDVMQMLLSATILRSQILEAHPEKTSKVILLIADSMAIREGAEEDKVSELVSLYKNSLDPLLNLLKMKECSDVILSSDLEVDQEYQSTLLSLEQLDALSKLREDGEHYAYIRTQTAITHYMHIHRNVGVKVGWICADSSQQLSNRNIEPKCLERWDELKFDFLFKTICQDSPMQYLYAKAGLKQPYNGNDKRRHVSVSEGCPYTAYEKDQRYLIQLAHKKQIRAICPLQKRVATHWKGVAEICSILMQLQVVCDTILPVGCIKKNNDVATVYNMLNHWSNYPTPSNKKT